MGNNHDRFYNKTKRKVLLTGIDGSGKTTLLEYIKTKQFNSSVAPSKDLNIETIKYGKKLKLIIFDLAGGERQRIFWRHNYPGTQGVIFMIDGSDDSKVEETKLELLKLLVEKELKECSILIFVNKLDKVEKKFDVDYYIDLFKIKEIMREEKRKIRLDIGSIFSEEGIKPALEWLVNTMTPI